MSSADNNLLSSINSTHVTSPPCPDRVANTPRSVGDCPNRQMTAWDQRKTDLRIPKCNKLSRAKRDKRRARGCSRAIESIDRSRNIFYGCRDDHCRERNEQTCFNPVSRVVSLVDDHPWHWCRRALFTTPHSSSLRQSLSKTHSQSCRTSRLSGASEKKP